MPWIAPVKYLKLTLWENTGAERKREKDKDVKPTAVHRRGIGAEEEARKFKERGIR